MRVGIITRVRGMRSVRERLIECGLPNKKIEHDVVGNVAAEFDLSRQTVLTFD